MMSHDDRTAARAAETVSTEILERPFAALARDVTLQGPLRAAVTAACRVPEPICVPPLIEAARLPPAMEQRAAGTARRLVEALRSKPKRGGVEGLVQEYSLSSQEGVALMCLAEALLRVPDPATRDALIRDKISFGDWRSHVGQSESLFVNAATWGLVVTGKLTASVNETGLGTALQRLIARGGEPLIRKGVDMAMRMMGEQFVSGETIRDALVHARKWEARGFRYSYDMLGEAAMTAADAARYFKDYETAIHAIGTAAAGRGPIDGPGISVKLSALHPRYARAQRERVLGELLPRLKALVVLARHYDIAVNIDAEESDRLEISLDLLEALCFAPELEGWNGIGFVVQAYGKRAPAVIDVLVDLAIRSRHRLMVRLVKGAYWDSEIKRAQVEGLAGYPVYTRKLYTDLSYLACARKLLGAPAEIFPQFATHNARTLATIHAMAGEFRAGQYEFQCLHGMGEPLYEEVVGHNALNRPCRIYAPVGTHETLLAYLVRRLLENGANSSFVNRIADPDVSIESLIADPTEEALAIRPIGSPHPAIALPGDLFGTARPNAAGLDLASEDTLAALAGALAAGSHVPYEAGPLMAHDLAPTSEPLREIRNPALQADLVGRVRDATPEEAVEAVSVAATAGGAWGQHPTSDRAAALRRAADLYEAEMPALMGTIVREAGKSLPNALGDVREAVDFLRYYAEEAEELQSGHEALGPVVCISPWNFPLAIFTGQVSAALAAGNAVLAKPAEETPLIAAQAVALLHRAGVPRAALQLLPGAGEVGAALVGDPRVAGVLFTGSTAVAKLIQKQLAQRLGPDGRTIPFVAETGGQNALVVDSSALPEQVVADVIASAFDSAGQRCSALRVLCLQEDIADRVLTMLEGAMAEIAVGVPDRLSTDVGPVITADAQATILDHVAAMRNGGRAVHALPLPEAAAHGTFVSPTLIEIRDIQDLEHEVFGPVLHVLRYRRDRLDALIDAINASGYGLTFGLHTRIDETIARVTARAAAGNIYINRNIIGAVVGVQPFGGNGLSGTGPKAGGPLYIRRLLRGGETGRLLDETRPLEHGTTEPEATRQSPPALRQPAPAAPAAAFRDWLRETGQVAAADRVERMVAGSLLGGSMAMPGPVGESNVYSLKPRGTVMVMAETPLGLFAGLAATLATGNRALLRVPDALEGKLKGMPGSVADRVAVAPSTWSDAAPAAVLFEGTRADLIDLHRTLAALPGGVVPVYGLTPEGLAAGREEFPLAWLLEEQTISTNTAAAGGNASLMAIG